VAKDVLKWQQVEFACAIALGCYGVIKGHGLHDPGGVLMNSTDCAEDVALDGVGMDDLQEDECVFE
jgi:hypothetical protein